MRWKKCFRRFWFALENINQSAGLELIGWYHSISRSKIILPLTGESLKHHLWMAPLNILLVPLILWHLMISFFKFLREVIIILKRNFSLILYMLMEMFLGPQTLSSSLISSHSMPLRYRRNWLKLRRNFLNWEIILIGFVEYSFVRTQILLFRSGLSLCLNYSSYVMMFFSL